MPTMRRLSRKTPEALANATRESESPDPETPPNKRGRGLLMAEVGGLDTPPRTTAGTFPVEFGFGSYSSTTLAPVSTPASGAIGMHQLPSEQADTSFPVKFGFAAVLPGPIQSVREASSAKEALECHKASVAPAILGQPSFRSLSADFPVEFGFVSVANPVAPGQPQAQRDVITSNASTSVASSASLASPGIDLTNVASSASAANPGIPGQPQAQQDIFSSSALTNLACSSSDPRPPPCRNDFPVEFGFAPTSPSASISTVGLHNPGQTNTGSMHTASLDGAPLQQPTAHNGYLKCSFGDALLAAKAPPVTSTIVVSSGTAGNSSRYPDFTSSAPEGQKLHTALGLAGPKSLDAVHSTTQKQSRSKPSRPLMGAEEASPQRKSTPVCKKQRVVSTPSSAIEALLETEPVKMAIDTLLPTEPKMAIETLLPQGSWGSTALSDTPDAFPFSTSTLEPFRKGILPSSKPKTKAVEQWRDAKPCSMQTDVTITKKKVTRQSHTKVAKKSEASPVIDRLKTVEVHWT